MTGQRPDKGKSVASECRVEVADAVTMLRAGCQAPSGVVLFVRRLGVGVGR